MHQKNDALGSQRLGNFAATLIMGKYQDIFIPFPSKIALQYAVQIIRSVIGVSLKCVVNEFNVRALVAMTAEKA